MGKATNFIQKISEYVYTPKNSLGIKRKDMPQIEDSSQDHFLKWLSSQGVKYSKIGVVPNQVKPSQNEINLDAVQKLIDSKSTKLNKPLITSKDEYVIDGHHRWMAHVNLKTKSIQSYKIDMNAKDLIKLMMGYDKVKTKTINNESIASRIISAFKNISEKLIIVNKGSKTGQIVIMAGGGGSGKGFAQKNIIDTSSYKTFDVDELKRLVIAMAKKSGDKEIANLDLRKPDDVLKLHKHVDAKGYESKLFDNLVKSIKASKTLPNLLFDVTLKDMRKINTKLENLREVGYKPEHTHIVWVLADYQVALDNNAQRDRVVPTDIMFQTHKGAAETMRSILSGNIPPDINGEIYVVFSDPRLTIKNKSKDKGYYFSDFIYAKVKESGKAIKSEEEIKKEVFFLAKEMVPSEVKSLFEGTSR